MYDINFYMQFDSIWEELKEKTISVDEARAKLEKARSRIPIIYNIETTNRCNMKCKMCPRTTMMTRGLEDINKEMFLRIVEQITPHNYEDWKKWKTFCENRYGIFENEMSENHFFLYIIPKVIQLHGYGDPLLDENMHEYVAILKEKGFESYFSCNPANINLERTFKMLDSGLNYIKYSIESVDDEVHKKVRGEASDFKESYNKILQVLDYKKKKGLATTIVITMLDLNRKNQNEDYDMLMKAFEGLDVYIYLKSEDCQWYREDYHGTNSIHWSEPCKHPWMSMTIKSNADVTMCMEDYNNDIILGNVRESSLCDIWNGKLYKEFREKHLLLLGDIRCHRQCDMKLVGEFFK